MTSYVYDFADGNKDLKDLLGGKGANLAEMTRLGLPVPPGFTITTEACQAYLDQGNEPEEMAAEVAAHLATLEEAMGRRLGDAQDPLLVSVRSGAKFSMPGMMDTVLNLGLNDESVKGLATVTGNERFAYDSYRRFIAMYGRIVLGVAGAVFDEIIGAKREAQRHIGGAHLRPREDRRPGFAERPSDRNTGLAGDIHARPLWQPHHLHRVRRKARRPGQVGGLPGLQLFERLAIHEPRHRAPCQPVEPPRALVEFSGLCDKDHDPAGRPGKRVKIGFAEVDGDGCGHWILRQGFAGP